MSKLAQIKELLSIINLLSDDTLKDAAETPRLVLIRTYSAGIHFGMLESRSGKEVVLTDARRIWAWKGANTLNEIVNNGVAAGSRISEPTSKITLTEVIEIIEMTQSQFERLSMIGWTK